MRWWVITVVCTSALALAGCASTTTTVTEKQASEPASASQADASTATSTQSDAASPEGQEGPGSSSHAEDEQFCSSHSCIASFAEGHGRVVECNDGEWSHSGGLSGACSDHGGENKSSMSGEQQTEEEDGSAATSSSEASAGTSPLNTLGRYWSDVKEHSFGAAYEYLAPGAAAGLTKSQFIQSEEKAGIRDAQFEGEVAHEAGDTAEVRVTSLVTQDNEFGCREWAGDYGLTREQGKWLIVRASITPHSC